MIVCSCKAPLALMVGALIMGTEAVPYAMRASSFQNSPRPDRCSSNLTGAGSGHAFLGAQFPPEVRIGAAWRFPLSRYSARRSGPGLSILPTPKFSMFFFGVAIMKCFICGSCKTLSRCANPLGKICKNYPFFGERQRHIQLLNIVQIDE